MTAIIDDTYAEAFKSMYSEVLITAVNKKWLDHAVNAATGNASSSILCDCEAGLDRYVGPGGDESVETPDGRPGAIIQLHIPKFWKVMEFIIYFHYKYFKILKTILCSPWHHN